MEAKTRMSRTSGRQQLSQKASKTKSRDKNSMKTMKKTSHRRDTKTMTTQHCDLSCRIKLGLCCRLVKSSISITMMVTLMLTITLLLTISPISSHKYQQQDHLVDTLIGHQHKLTTDNKQKLALSNYHQNHNHNHNHQQQSKSTQVHNEDQARRARPRRHSLPAERDSTQQASSMLFVSELRLAGSKNEPPSRPSVEWSRQKPQFAADLQRDVSVELGKSAYLTCKVLDRGDKTVSWLRPRENEILTVGKFTYAGDPRITPINQDGSDDWILEIKDVGLNDSTSYECQVSTDPKMSVLFNLQVKAAKAKIREGENYYVSAGSRVEFACDVSSYSPVRLANNLNMQTYWYFNGNLLNYNQLSQPHGHSHNHQLQHLAHQHDAPPNKNFTIEREFYPPGSPLMATSKFRLANVQPSDSGNYTCKPTSAEPATIRLYVKKAPRGAANSRSPPGSQPRTGSSSLADQRSSLKRLNANANSNQNELELPITSSARSVLTLDHHSSPMASSLLVVWLMAVAIALRRLTPAR